jgi:hypothetical protein
VKKNIASAAQLAAGFVVGFVVGFGQGPHG